MPAGDAPARGHVVVLHALFQGLDDTGVRDLDMPASPSRVWEAIQAAKP